MLNSFANAAKIRAAQDIANRTPQRELQTTVKSYREAKPVHS